MMHLICIEGRCSFVRNLTTIRFSVPNAVNTSFLSTQQNAGFFNNYYNFFFFYSMDWLPSHRHVHVVSRNGQRLHYENQHVRGHCGHGQPDGAGKGPDHPGRRVRGVLRAHRKHVFARKWHFRFEISNLSFINILRFNELKHTKNKNRGYSNHYCLLQNRRFEKSPMRLCSKAQKVKYVISNEKLPYYL